jgi:signal transduction histidine kinase
MNLPLTPELSLYQLTQTLDFPPHPLMVRASTFKALIAAWFDLLIEQRLEATVWLKLPGKESWFTEVERYHREGLASHLYCCLTHQQTAPANMRPPHLIPGMVPIVLEASAQLTREYFILVACPQLCGLLLAQQPLANLTGERGRDRPQAGTLKLVYSFVPSVIASVLGGIKQAIAIADTTPEELLTQASLSESLPTSPDPRLLSELVRRHIQLTESHHPPASNASEKQTSQQTSSPLLDLSGDFLNHLTRELSLPLTNMKTALRLLDSKQHQREQRRRYLDLLQQECDRQSTLLTGLLEFAQSSQPLEISESSLKLEDLVPGLVSTYQPIAEEKGILLGYTIPAGLPPVSCQSHWLRQILRQILNNSLKFTRPRGRVNVQAFLKEDWIELTITDTGCGIDSSDLPQIFNSFYRGRNALSEELAGAGLGLTIAQSLVQRCGGKITVTSQVGRGTTLKILLPVASS